MPEGIRLPAANPRASGGSSDAARRSEPDAEVRRALGGEHPIGERDRAARRLGDAGGASEHRRPHAAEVDRAELLHPESQARAQLLCDGLGVADSVDPGLVVPDPGRTIDGGAIAPMTGPSFSLRHHLGREVVEQVCAHFGIPRDVPWRKLPARAKKILLEGSDEKLTIYREWKQLRALELTRAGDVYQFEARFTHDEQSGVLVIGSIDEDGSITIVTEEAAEPPMCPICLTRGTLIATPEGSIAVEPGGRAHPAGIGHRAIVRSAGVPRQDRFRRCASGDVPPAGFEPAHPAPEAGALSPELRGRRGESSNRPTPAFLRRSRADAPALVGILDRWRSPSRTCWWSTTIR